MNLYRLRVSIHGQIMPYSVHSPQLGSPIIKSPHTLPSPSFVSAHLMMDPSHISKQGNPFRCITSQLDNDKLFNLHHASALSSNDFENSVYDPYWDTPEYPNDSGTAWPLFVGVLEAYNADQIRYV